MLSNYLLLLGWGKLTLVCKSIGTGHPSQWLEVVRHNTLREICLLDEKLLHFKTGKPLLTTKPRAITHL